MDDLITYNFETINDPADPQFNGLTFNNLQGINNFGEIDGFYGSGASGGPQQRLSPDSRHVHAGELSRLGPDPGERAQRPGHRRWLLLQDRQWRGF